MTDGERKATSEAFAEAVNMTAADLEEWLEDDESKSVGWANGKLKTKPEGPESVGHASGRHIVRILRKTTSELTDADYRHMRKVVGYVKRHSAQRPKAQIEGTRWRASLMNWGHDPLKD